MSRDRTVRLCYRDEGLGEHEAFKYLKGMFHEEDYMSRSRSYF